MTRMPPAHPTRDQLLEFLQGRLNEAETDDLERHVDDCKSCCETLNELNETEDPFLRPLRSDAEHPNGEVQSPDEGPPLPAAYSVHEVPLSHEAPGSWIGPYRLVTPLGEGGMGIVYRAEQEHPVRRRVALKIVKPGMDSRQVVTRFAAERQALALMDHANIARVLDGGTTSAGRPYFVAELVEGPPITTYCDRHELALGARLALFILVCRAVAHAHQKGIVHRDIKPSNVLVAECDGAAVPKIIDFGVAKSLHVPLTEQTLCTRYGQLVGTLEYMSPEQAALNRDDIDTRSDIYSLGALLYELVTGSPPLEHAALRDTAFDETLRTIREVDPERPSVRVARRGASGQTSPQPQPRRIWGAAPLRGDLDAIVMKALDKERDRRYATATELAADIERYLQDEPVTARPPSATYSLQKFARRHRGLLVAATIVFCLLLLSTIASVWQAVRATRANAKADQEAVRARLAQQEESKQRQLAEQHAEESQRRLAKLYITNGNNAADNGAWSTALLWYSHAWSADSTTRDRDASHRRRFAAAVHRMPGLVGLCCHPGIVLDASLDSSGKRLLTRTDESRAYLWNPFKGKLLIPPLVCSGRMLHAALSPNGKLVAACDSDGGVQIWDSPTGQPTMPSIAHPAAMNWIAFSPDSRVLATACADRNVRCFSMADGAVGPVVIDCGAPAEFVEFSPDGSRLVTANGKQKARAWNLSDGSPASPELEHRMRPGNPADDLRQPPLISADGALLLTASHRTIHLWNLAERKVAAAPIELPFELNSMSISADKSKLLAVGRSTGGRVIDLATRKVLSQLPHPREVQQGCISPDGTRAATASSGGMLHFWSTEDGDQALPNVNHASNAICMRYSADGRYVLSTSFDGTARLWRVDRQPFEPEPYDFTSGFSYRIGWLPRSNEFDGAATSWDGKWELLWRGDDVHVVRRGEAPNENSVTIDHGEEVQNARFTRDRTRILTLGPTRAKLWDAQSGQQVGKPWTFPAAIVIARLSDSGWRIAAVDRTRRGYVWDFHAGRLIAGPLTPRELSPRAISETSFTVGVSKHAQGYYGCAFSPDGRLLALCTKIFVEVFDLSSGEHVLIDLPSGFISSAEFSADGNWLVVAGSNNTARVWNARTGEPISPPMRHPSYVRLADFSYQGQSVVTYSSDGRLRVWDPVSGELLVPAIPSPYSPPSRIWFSRDGNAIVAAPTRGRTGSQWRLPSFTASSDSAVKLAHLLTGRQIDEADGIVRVDVGILRRDADEYQNSWLASHGIEAN